MAQPKRRKTAPGLGCTTPNAGPQSDSRIAVPQLPRESKPPPKRRTTRDIAMSFVPAEPANASNGFATNEATTGVKRKRPTREALQIDEVPVSTRKIALPRMVTVVPRIINAALINKAPLDSRDAFVLQLIDGTLSLSDLADVSGVSKADIEGILARLVRLGIITM